MPAVFLNSTDERPPGFAGSAISIGNFDGVHRGHQALIATAKREAEGGPVVAVSFDPPPYQVLFPNSPARLPLTTLDVRTRLLLATGADHVAILRATPELLALTPEEFFRNVIVRQFGAKVVVEGFNFRFGINRTGSTGTLRRLCQQSGMYFEEVPPFELNGEPVSSSRVRAALVSGEVARASTFLGRSYSITGTVVAGARRGRTLGFPTCNLADVPTVLPGNGVYAVRARAQGTVWPAAANVGPNPTFGEDARKVEVHLIGFTGDLYGSTLEVDFVQKLRDTQPFSGIAELTAQLQRDLAAAQAALTVHQQPQGETT